MAEDVVHQEFLYYLEHQDEFVKEYDGKYIVLHRHVVVGAYESLEAAYFESVKHFELGTFLIQRCTPGTEAYTLQGHYRLLRY